MREQRAKETFLLLDFGRGQMNMLGDPREESQGTTMVEETSESSNKQQGKVGRWQEVNRHNITFTPQREESEGKIRRWRAWQLQKLTLKAFDVFSYQLRVGEIRFLIYIGT